MNQSMQMVTKVMPLMFGLFAVNFPAAIAFYILIGQIFQIGQQHMIMKRMPHPAAAAVVDVGQSSKKATTPAPTKKGATSAANKKSTAPATEARAVSGRITPKKKG